MLNNEKGSAMVVSLISISVILILTIAFIFLSSSNIRHASKEEGSTQAHYVAKTGAETIIKHLRDTADSTGDMRAELVKLIDRTNSGNKTEGIYKNKKFVIEAKKEIRTDATGIDKTVYLIKGKSKVGTGSDWITAVLTPEYDVEQGWGNGTVDAGDEIFLSSLKMLKGGGITLNTESIKKVGGDSPIKIQSGANGEEIMKLFDGNPNGTDVLNGYTLGNRDESLPYVNSETLMHTDINTKVEPVKLNYDISRNKPALSFPTSYGSGIVKSNITIDVNNPTIGQLVTEEYSFIDFNKKGKVEKDTNKKEYLKISADVFKLEGKNTIITSKKTDVVIYTKVFFLNEYSELNIKGPGKVYIFATDQADIHQYSKVGVDLDDPTSVAANTNIHFYIKDGLKFGLEDNAEVRNAFLYGPRSGVGLDGGSVFTGRMSVDTVDFNGETTIQSPVPGTPDEDNDPIVGFETIEWER